MTEAATWVTDHRSGREKSSGKNEPSPTYDHAEFRILTLLKGLFFPLNFTVFIQEVIRLLNVNKFITA